MKLSIAIVNYNVKYFLKQCLASVYHSDRTLSDGSTLELEVWVVDNDSVDGSVEMVRSDYPQVHLIENHDNVGFARANNQALGQATGDVLLLLNPDTLVESDTFVQCLDHLAAHPECGGLCVKMVDGEGRYLRESKRGFPTPQAAFCKLCGLARLFPRSRRLAAYYMGHLPDDQAAEIDIMPGAFLMVTREAYSRIGGLDESYFMYGEDIDYSWRIRQAGFTNRYLPQTHIIHYKGESTKKGSLNYVYTFYNAMSIFVSKYHSGRNARLFRALLHVAIWFRAAMTWLGATARRLAVPALDFAVAYGGFVLLKQIWAVWWRGDYAFYPPLYTLAVIPAYILVLMACSWLSGGYDKPLRLGRIVRGMGIGLLLLLAFYSLLDEHQRYSRMLLLAGSLWTIAATLANRAALSALGVKGYALRTRRRGNTLIVGSLEESGRVRQLYLALGVPESSLLTDHDPAPHRLRERIRIERIEEVVFCGADMDLRSIITLMEELHTSGVEYKIAPAEGDFIIGTGGILARDEVYLDTVSTDTNRRRKRLFDIGTAALLLLATPLLIWFQQHKGSYAKHCLQVLAGRLTWVGYSGRPGRFSPADIFPSAPQRLQEDLTLRYMHHYKPSTDAAILVKNWNKI
ncbi:MAG: glycosyltransferase [Bacteroidales bacterium]|nr:glycosyltransferase [Bacteroidales bacterium]